MEKFNVGDRVKNVIDGQKGTVVEVSSEDCFGDVLSVKLDDQQTCKGIEMVLPKTKEKYVGLMLPVGFWEKCDKEDVKNMNGKKFEKFDWNDFLNGNLTVYFDTNEDQHEFLVRCDQIEELRWNSGDKPSELSYHELPISAIRRGNNQRRLVAYNFDREGNRKYNWSKGCYVDEKASNEWTEGEILRAKDISHDILCEIFDNGGCIDFTENYEGCTYVMANYYPHCGTCDGTIVAQAKNNDVFNEFIGKCVCLCKATKKPIPSFILNKNKSKGRE
jgi:hypothetical protein